MASLTASLLPTNLQKEFAVEERAKCRANGGRGIPAALTGLRMEAAVPRRIASNWAEAYDVKMHLSGVKLNVLMVEANQLVPTG
eukprot:788205-Amphidinium_carterae.1